MSKLIITGFKIGNLKNGHRIIECKDCHKKWSMVESPSLGDRLFLLDHNRSHKT